MSRVKAILVAAATCWLAACGESTCRLQVEPQALRFDAAQGAGSPPAQQLEATFEGSSVGADFDSSGKPTWINLSLLASSARKSEFKVEILDTSLPVAVYSTLVRLLLTGHDGSEAWCTEIPVTYALKPLEQAPALVTTPAEPTLQVDTSTTEAQLTFPLELSSSGRPLDWHVVSISGSWLEAAVTSGNTQTETSPQLHVSKSTVAGLDNGSYSATVTLAYDGASSERQVAVPVKLTVALPRVSTVTPYAAEAGRSLSHILRGEGFSGLKSAQSLHLGPATPSSYQIVSDTELRLDVPALPEGDHAVFVENALGLTKPGTTLHAVRTPAFAEFSLLRENSPQRVIYDPLRLAVYTVEYRPSLRETRLYRYRYIAGSWEEDELTPSLSGVFDAAMDVDGQGLYVSTDMELYRLSLSDPSSPTLLQRPFWNSELEVLNDGYLLATSDSSVHTATSLDGRRTVISGLSFMRTFDASSTAPRDAPLVSNRMGAPIAVDRTARYVASLDSVYDAQWGLIAGLGVMLDGLLFSPDARRLMGFYSGSQAGQMLYVYDVASPPARGRFTRVAELLMEGAGSGEGISCSGFITPDGRTLITVGQKRFHVFPLPPSIQ